MTSRTPWWMVAAGLAALGVAACQHTSDGRNGSRVPTEAEARGVLAQYEAAAAKATDAASYCAISFIREMCESSFNRHGGIAGVPTSPPTIVSSSRVEGGFIRVLVLCGKDGLGKPYRTDFPVERDLEHPETLRAGMPVYWSGAKYEGLKSDDFVPTVQPGGTATGNVSC